jgi:hypothetical protein
LSGKAVKEEEEEERRGYYRPIEFATDDSSSAGNKNCTTQ